MIAHAPFALPASPASPNSPDSPDAGSCGDAGDCGVVVSLCRTSAQFCLHAAASVSTAACDISRWFCTGSFSVGKSILTENSTENPSENH